MHQGVEVPGTELNHVVALHRVDPVFDRLGGQIAVEGLLANAFIAAHM